MQYYIESITQRNSVFIDLSVLFCIVFHLSVLRKSTYNSMRMFLLLIFDALMIGVSGSFDIFTALSLMMLCSSILCVILI